MAKQPVRRNELPDGFDLHARSNMARDVRMSGNLHAARQLQESLVADLRGGSNEDRLEGFGVRLDLARTMFLQRDLAGARALQESALADMVDSLGTGHVYVQSARAALAETLESQGELARARPLRLAVSRGLGSLLPPGHMDLRAARSNLARTMHRLGDSNGARRLQELVLAELEQSGAPEFEVDRIRVDLATTLSGLGAFARAAELLEEVLAAPEEGERLDRYALLRARACLARIRVRAGYLDLARRELEAAWERASIELPNGDAERLEVGVELLGVHLALGERAAAEELAQLLGRQLLRALCTALIPVVPGDGASATRRDRLEWIAERWMSASCDLVSTELRLELTVTLRHTSRFACVVASDLTFYRDLARTAAADPERIGRFAPAAIAQRLEAGTVAVELVRTTAWSVESCAGNVLEAPSLSGYVIGADGKPLVVELGPIREIERLARSWVRTVREASERTPKLELLAGEALRARLLDPLCQSIGPEVRALLFSTDDALAALPLNALPLEDKTVGDVLEVGADASLVAPTRSSDARDPSDTEELLIVGNPAFDAAPVDARPLSPRSPAIERRRQESSDAASSKNDELLSTEIEWLGDTYRRTHDRTGTVLTGAAATKDAFCRLAPGKRFLHLALPIWSDERPVDPSSPHRVSPESRSCSIGFLMAGADHGRDLRGRVPGVVTAEEIAALDLSACQVAVLAGDSIRPALRGPELSTWITSLRAAGVDTVIASLGWIDRSARPAFLERLYQALWVERECAVQAVAEARNSFREVGRPKRDWAGWIVAGAPNPSRSG